MSRLLLCACALTVLSACNQDHKTAAQAQAARRPILLNITKGPDDAHEVTMALQLAGHALDQGRAVTLFFNVEGVSVPVRSLDAKLAFKDKPIKQLLADCMSRGAAVLVCPHCMKAKGVTETDLIEGARVASADSLLGVVDRGAAVFTY